MVKHNIKRSDALYGAITLGNEVYNVSTKIDFPDYPITPSMQNGSVNVDKRQIRTKSIDQGQVIDWVERNKADDISRIIEEK